MTTYNTGNPLGSVDVRDLYDNAQNTDNFASGPLDYYADRFGVMRQSLQGIRSASQYVDIGPYAAGLVFTARNQVFSYLGEFYAHGPAITLPYTTTGAGAGEIANFRSVGDAVLRSDMANSADPAKGAALVGFSSETVYSALTRALASNTLDTTRIDVASASTVNLTLAAPSTRHINITGTTTINGFTAVAGVAYFVRFNAALTLTNNASIVTQSGANIITAAGDTCIIRATAANVVEVLAYTPVTALLDTTRIDVPSAATVNLTTSAPNTRHINITGATTITAFTVAVGRCYFVRFAGTLTLTNNANIVTQSGANIGTAAGDTCIIRATAANVVEVLSYCRVQRLTLGTSQATTSGTSIDFTGLPSWTKKITVMLGGVSTSGTSNLQIQLGTSGGVTTTGYVSSATTPDGGTATQSSTSGMLITEQTNAATYTLTGIASINLISGNTWVSVGGVASSEPRVSSSAGTVSLSSALDRIRLTTVNGTDEFDAGSVNIIVEG